MSRRRIIPAIVHRRNLAEAKRLRGELQAKLGTEKFDQLHSLVLNDWQGDVEQSEAAFRNRMGQEADALQILADLITVIQFAILVYRILKHLGLLMPSPSQVNLLLDSAETRS